MATTTSQLVTRVRDYYLPKWSRTAILDLLNITQKALFANDTSQTAFHTFTDPEFPFPILSTTAGTLTYSITGANLVNSAGAAVSLTWGGHAVTARRVRRVFLQITAIGAGSYTNQFYGQEFNLAGLNEYWSRRLSRTTFYEVPIKPYDRTENEACKVMFVEDPGTYTDRYLVEFYINPIELDAETDVLSVDADKWGQALIDGVVGLAEDSMYGKSERLDKFSNYWMKKWCNSQNEGSDKLVSRQYVMREAG